MSLKINKKFTVYELNCQVCESSHVKYDFRGIILSFKNLTEMDMRGVEVIT